MAEMLTAARFMEICHLTPVTLGRLAKEGKITRGEGYGTYPDTSITEYILHLQETIQSRPGEGSTPEKLFRHYRAVQAKLKAEEMAGTLVNVEKFDAAMGGMIHRSVARLDAIPDAACSVLRELLGEDAEEALAEVRKILIAHVHDACAELANIDGTELAGISPVIEELEGVEDGSEEAQVEDA